MALLNKHKRLFLAFGIVICLTAIVVTITGVAPASFLGRGVSYVVVPMQRGASSATGWIAGRISILAQSAEILAENQALHEENARLRNANTRLEAVHEEYFVLLERLRMRERYPELSIVGARMIGQNPNDWQPRFMVNIGERAGIAPNMVVLGDGGVLGVVRETGPNYALIVSIMDNDFAAAARNSRTEDVGVVIGDLDLRHDGLMRMRYIEASARFMPGDEIVTSDHGAFFPPGLLIGTVVSVHPGPEGGLIQYAIIQPAANLDRVDIVLIVDQLFGEDTETEG